MLNIILSNSKKKFLLLQLSWILYNNIIFAFILGLISANWLCVIRSRELRSEHTTAYFLYHDVIYYMIIIHWDNFINTSQYSQLNQNFGHVRTNQWFVQHKCVAACVQCMWEKSSPCVLLSAYHVVLYCMHTQPSHQRLNNIYIPPMLL